MGPKGAVEIIFREDGGDPQKIAARTEEYRPKFANPFVAGCRGYIDDVIMPHGTRKRICRALAMLRTEQIENPPEEARQHSLVKVSTPTFNDKVIRRLFSDHAVLHEPCVSVPLWFEVAVLSIGQ